MKHVYCYIVTERGIIESAHNAWPGRRKPSRGCYRRFLSHLWDRTGSALTVTVMPERLGLFVSETISRWHHTTSIQLIFDFLSHLFNAPSYCFFAFFTSFLLSFPVAEKPRLISDPIVPAVLLTSSLTSSSHTDRHPIILHFFYEPMTTGLICRDRHAESKG